MEIVNNQNQKYRIKVWRNPFDQSGLGPKKRVSFLKKLDLLIILIIFSKQNKKKDKEEKKSNRLDLVRNRFDVEQRDLLHKTYNYLEDLRGGYLPIDIQQKQEKLMSREGDKHFIRRKQSQANINLKRTCGVSYVKPTESEQKNVDHIFRKLTPLVF